jgi:hypothetical protein
MIRTPIFSREESFELRGLDEILEKGQFRPMKKNMHTIDRILRFVIGVALLSYALAGGPVWAYIGLIPLATAAWSFCPIYALLKFKRDR